MLAIEDVLAALQQLPASVNPYGYLASALASSLVPAVPSSFRTLLLVCTGLYAALGLLVLATIGITLYHGDWYIARQRQLPTGQITQVSSLVYSAAVLIFVAFVEAWIQLIIDAYSGGSLALQQWVAAPVWTAFSTIFLLAAYDATSTAWVRYSGRIRGTRISTTAFNVAWLALVAMLLGLFAIFIWAAHSLRDTERLLRSISVTLLSQPWSAGQPFNPDAELTTSLVTFTSEASDTVDTIQNAYSYLAALMVLQALISIPATIARVRILHDARGGLAVSAFLRHSRAHQDGTRLVAKRKTVHFTILSLIAEALGIFIVSIVFTAEAVWIAIDAPDILTDGTLLTISYVLGLLSFAVFAIPVQLLLLRRAINTYRKGRSVHRGAIEGVGYGIAVTAETVVKVDRETGTQMSETAEPVDAVDVAYMAMAREKRDHNLHGFRGALAFVDLAPVESAPPAWLECEDPDAIKKAPASLSSV